LGRRIPRLASEGFLRNRSRSCFDFRARSERPTAFSASSKRASSQPNRCAPVDLTQRTGVDCQHVLMLNANMKKTCLHLRRTIGACVHPSKSFVMSASLALVLGSASPGVAQLREPSQGGRAASEMSLRNGDFVTATASAPSAMTLRLIQPDGSLLRTWMVDTTPSPIAFVAATTGVHRWQFVPAGATAPVEGRGVPAGDVTVNAVTSLDTRLKPRIVDHSPMMQELRRRVAAGDWKADAFWTDVATRGTPIVDEGDDTRYQIVTFLWRALSETRNVSIIGTFMKAPLAEAMQHVPGTDVWYRSFRVPAGARFSYFLSANSPLVFDGPDAAQQFATLQADPLNPRRWMCAPDAGIYQCQSRAELPGAVAQPWVAERPEVARGRLERHDVTSRRLGNTRGVSVYVPAGAACEHERCALLVVFDGPQYLSLVPTPGILDNLRADGRVPPVVAVFVTQQSRARELACNEDFAAFVATELIPWAQQRYHAGRRASDVVVAGSSFGGLAAAFVALRHPGVIGNVLSQSGNFAWAPDRMTGPNLDATTEGGWLIKEYIGQPRQPLRFYLDAGVFEADRFVTGGAILESTRHFRDVLRAKGYTVSFGQFTGGHDYLSWRGTLADGLIELIGTPLAR
jgi:enterochelin esterase-like enzyme